MKILMVSAAILPFWKCGVATVVDDIRESLQKMGHTVGMFALDLYSHQDSIVVENDAQCWLTATTVSDKCAYVSDNIPEVKHVNERFIECLSVFRPDVVHFHTPQYFSLSLIEKAKLAGARTVITLHDWWWICPSQFFSPVLGKKCGMVSRENCLECMKQTKEGQEEYESREEAMNVIESIVDCFSCVSSIVYNDFVRIKPHLKNKTCIIPNPVPERAEKIYPIEGPLTFAFLGGRHEIKGYSQVVEAFSALETTGEWKLNIYGGTIQGVTKDKRGIRSYFAKAAKYFFHPIQFARKVKQILFGIKIEQKTRSSINHLPSFEKKDIQNILLKNHVVLVCSQVQESFSLVTYEAMANGCCVIATPCGGPETIVESGRNGILLKGFDSGKIEEAIRYLIKSRDTVEEYRNNAFELSKEFKKKEEIGRMYLNLYVTQ